MKQIRLVQDGQVYVTLSATAAGHLTHDRAVQLINTFTDSTWNTFDAFTTMFYNVSILSIDETRPEGYRFSCIANCKEFTCCHFLAAENSILEQEHDMEIPHERGFTVEQKRIAIECYDRDCGAPKKV